MTHEAQMTISYIPVPWPFVEAVPGILIFSQAWPIWHGFVSTASLRRSSF